MNGLWRVRVYPWDTDPADWNFFFQTREDAFEFCDYLNANFDHVMLAMDPASTGIEPVYFEFSSAADAINTFRESFGDDDDDA